MKALLLSPQAWSEHEFGTVPTGDARRGARLVAVGAALGAQPGASLPAALGNWAALQGAYRLLDGGALSHARVQEAHVARCRAACQQEGTWLLVEDSTLLDFSSRPATEELGPVGDGRGRGLMLHTTLALRLEAGWEHQEGALHPQLEGLFGQELWARPPEGVRPGEKKAQRLERARESQRWGRALEGQRAPSPAQWISVADREADIYEFFLRARAAGAGFVVRACQPRALEGEDGRSLFAAAQAAPPLGEAEVALRARAGKPARQARLRLRACALRLRAPWRPGGRGAALEVTVLEAREECARRANQGAKKAPEALQWVLLTSLPVPDLAHARRVLEIYRQRWRIEDYHKALKTGAAVESAQLRSAARLAPLVGILAVLAVRLLALQLLAAARPDAPLEPADLDPRALGLLQKRFGSPPGERWTAQASLRAIARLGGFLARRHDGSPGWITLWRGLRRLLTQMEAFD